MIYRKAEKEDIEQVMALRLKLLIEEGATVPKCIDAEMRQYFTEELNQNLIVMVAEDEGKMIATSSVIFQKYPPSFSNPRGIRAYITNVYTEPEYRRQGISTVLLDQLFEVVKAEGLNYVWLWATEQGIPLYEKYGFKELKDFVTMDYKLTN